MAPRLTIFALLHVLVWLFDPIAAGSLAAWSTGLGAPQLIMQDDATGKIFYSLCNSNGTSPIFPANETASFNLDLPPKNGTSLAGIGYANDGVNIAAIWYLNDASQIVEALWQCDPTGHFIPGSTPNNWIVSSGQPVNSSTGLSAVNLGAQSGYQVYFHDDHMATSILRYTTADGWRTDGNISQDAVKTLPINAGFTDNNKISVVYGRGPSNIEVSTLQQNGEWVVTLFPTPLNLVDRDSDNTTTLLPVTNDTAPEDFTLNTTANWALEGWDGSAKGIGLTFNDDSTRNIFYIGNDSLLHQVSETSGGWQASSGQSVQSWPIADSPSSQFASTYDFNRNQVWIYYVSGGNVTQVYRSGKNSWEPAAALRTFNDTVIESDEDSDLSTGAKAGIGVGVGVVGAALITLGAFFFLRRRKRSREAHRQAETEAEATSAAADHPVSSFAGSPAPAYSSGVMQGQWIDGQWIQASQTKPEGQWQERYSYAPVDQQQPVFHEMASQEHTHEMPGDTGRRELPTNHTELEEGRP
ncbi:hypothetical protein F4821DRAFT_120836 [Hypoxylon rubiginosum]|uniref:Uncharacterized protein n=1 Tax=Hypoxylon rubiginosum TaxID=110542 RepID=A0ACC0D2M3_9PEZI|nr:hypothetical protein F4821DRAFT_120836 [Hypoxylon rubiginosum]